MELNRVCLPTPPVTVESTDFTLYKRATFKPVFKFKNSDGTPMSLLNIIVTFYIEDDKAQNILTISSDSVNSNGSTIVVVDEANGIVDILITDEETTSLSFTKANWWVSITLSNGEVYPRGHGDIYLKQPFE